jgi:hypothetical protein
LAVLVDAHACRKGDETGGVNLLSATLYSPGVDHAFGVVVVSGEKHCGPVG